MMVTIKIMAMTTMEDAQMMVSFLINPSLVLPLFLPKKVSDVPAIAPKPCEFPGCPITQAVIANEISTINTMSTIRIIGKLFEIHGATVIPLPLHKKKI